VLIDEHPFDEVHVEKEVVENESWDTVEDFRGGVEWGVYND